MNAFRTLALAATVAGAAPLAAQGSCEINVGGSPELNGARQYYTNAARPGRDSEKPKHLANGVRVLSSEKALRHGNQLGRNWMMGKMLYQWSRMDKQPMMTTRGDVGFEENKSQPLDLLAAMDTAFTNVEQLNAACADSTRMYRRNLWSQIYSAGVNQLNAGNLDSAKMLFRRSMVIKANDPSAYNGLAIVAQRQNDEPAMIENFTKVIQYASGDTAMEKIVEGAVNNVAILRLQQAESLEGPQKTAALKEAETLFRNYLAKQPRNTGAQQGLARVLGALGDTAGVKQIYAGMVQNPDDFTDIQLFEAGSNAVRAGQQQMGVQLMEAGLTKNPYYRDGLYNLAAVYFDQENADKLGETARRLVEIDPQNPDNWRLYAGQFQIRNEEAKKAKKTPPKPVLDSLLHYITKFNDMKVQVQVNQFTHAGAKHTLSGSVINSSAKPVDGTLEIEFLDKDGQVVARKAAPIKAAPNASADFTVDVTQSGIIAYRYKPIA